MISNFEELVIRASNEGSRNNIGEAIRCYEAGSFRAAIVSAYVAMCFDLIDKLRQLASAGDGKAKVEIEKLDRYYEQLKGGNSATFKDLLEFERRLLDLFFIDFDFFDIHQFEELKRLRDDRNKCAHPSVLPTGQHYSPSPELARLHIRNTLIYVLQHPPRQGRAAIAGLKELILSPYFPEDDGQAARSLKASDLGNARPPLIVGIVDELLFGWPNPAHEFYHQGAAIRAIFALLEIHRSEALARMKINVDKLLKRSDDDCVALGSFLAVRIIDIGHNLGDGSVSTVSSWLLKLSDPQVGNFTSNALRISKLRSAALQKAAILTPDELAPGVYIEPAPEVVTRAVELYSGAGNWVDANSLAHKCAVPFVSYMTEAHVRRIFEAATRGKADLIGSNTLPTFVKALYSHSSLGRTVLDGIFDEFDLSRYKTYGESDTTLVS
ncbi:hypothetical protein [Pararhizobium sp. LjRoot238]|uniref:hypothetical protein n=1 Tax=Pararhizobium sp. LjRoot238 TaxID=3342293 RepID=UPI003ECF1837